MTNQEIFDKVVNHLRTQNKQAIKVIDGVDQCQYRAVDENGCVTMCAAGCLIPDEDYKPSFEGGTVMIGAVVGNYFSNKGYTNDQIYLVRDLQKVHDYAHLWANREASLKEVAETFGLTYTAPAV